MVWARGLVMPRKALKKIEVNACVCLASFRKEMKNIHESKAHSSQRSPDIHAATSVATEVMLVLFCDSVALFSL